MVSVVSVVVGVVPTVMVEDADDVPMIFGLAVVD
jgi:hypothetical protein